MKDCARNLGKTALVFSGGVGLGAYQAGAYAHLQDHSVTPQWLAGSSAGAVNAVLIAGNPPEKRVSALRTFWMGEDTPFAKPSNPFAPTAWRHVQNWIGVIETRLFGARGYFRPRLLAPRFEPLCGLYDLTPMRQRIEQLVDFGQLNSGDIRCTVATTDIETGDMVLFDTARGARIGIDHLLASCGFLPEFPLREIDGRLLGDGGLSGNAPIEAVLDTTEELRTIFVLDLYPRDGPRPTDLESALARKADLTFGNQTYMRLDAYRRELLLREELANLKQGSVSVPRPTMVLLSYQPTPDEAGSERAFDLTRDSAEHRWRSGGADMQEALDQVAGKQHGQDALITVRRSNDTP
jgi:NTE family protein